MQIIVEPGDWGDVLLCDITRLLEDVSSHIEQTLRDSMEGTVLVRLAPHYDWTPRTHIRSSASDPFTIQLTAQGKLWAKCSYQFSHEFCHVLSGHERLKDNPNNWFHEAICELASVFTLRRMAERWPARPPYPNWVSYAVSLASYTVQAPVASGHVSLLSGAIKQVLSSEENTLREASLRKAFGDFSQSDRDKIAVISHALLPIFESEPAGWNAVRNVPATKGPLTEYLADWYAQVELADKPFLKRILDVFELTP